MKTRLIASLLVTLFLLGCRQDNAPSDLVITECVGVTQYYLTNQSTRSLSVDFIGHVDGAISPATLVNSQQTTLIGQDSRFGAIPKPASTFSSVTLSTVTDEKKTVIYTQSPVRNELWTLKKQNVNDPDFGCQQVSYTLTITDDALK